MPRTTIDIETPILEELKRLQEKEGVSLGALASTFGPNTLESFRVWADEVPVAAATTP